MISLVIPAKAEGDKRFVTRLNDEYPATPVAHDSHLISKGDKCQVYSGQYGIIELLITDEATFDQDVVAIDPLRGTAERLIRANSSHNTFLVTERCDQLCVMCSQPPKKTHVDRFSEFAAAALLAPYGETIGISGGEPTLYKEDLLTLIEKVSGERPDVSFHVLTNGQHFEASDIKRLQTPAFNNVTWGIPLYSHDANTHDDIVVKQGAFERLMESFVHLLKAGAQIELRTVILKNNVKYLPDLARYVATHLGFIVQWSLMQLENIGFAKARFNDLYVDHSNAFDPFAEALDCAELFGVKVALFNFTRCSIPKAYQRYAIASISDWKRKYPSPCNLCAEQSRCCGFFDWHPDAHMKVYPL